MQSKKKIVLAPQKILEANLAAELAPASSGPAPEVERVRGSRAIEAGFASFSASGFASFSASGFASF